jgi:predicted SAM-dependent methyltransferase
MGKKRLNLGCGINWKRDYPDWPGLDMIDYGQEHIGDVIELLPRFKGESLDEVMANHFLEHFNQDQLRIIFSEVNRILRYNGLFRFVIPHKDGERAWDLSHKTFWNENTVTRLGEPDWTLIHAFGKWKVEEVTVNKRPDIHARLRKR